MIKDFLTLAKQEVQNAIIFPPTYSFEIGEHAVYGNHINAVVTNKTSDGKVYAVEVERTERNKTYKQSSIVVWHKLFKLTEQKSSFTTKLQLNYRTLSSPISGIIDRCEHAGVEFDTNYQRGLVWTHEQKTALIATIFDKGSIGTFSFNRRSYDTAGPLYECVDGKQRLTTLVEFSQNQFPFCEKYFCELSKEDRNTFKNHNVLVYDLEDGSEKDILQLFLLVNRRGTPVDGKHIAYVEKLLQHSLKSGTN